jgi:DNA-binding NarL/FixJ family response regulator
MARNGKLRVLVVDDHAVLRTGLCLLLESEGDMVCGGEAGTAEEALDVLDEAQPDVVVIDLEMPGMGGLAGMAEIRRRRPDIPVLVLSMHDHASDVRRAFAAGAAGYLVKHAADRDLFQAVRAVARGESYLDPSLGAKLAEPVAAMSAVQSLSAREQEVLRLVALGHTNQEVAESLGVSPRTVESRRARVGEKLGLDSRADMAKLALAAGLLDDYVSV